MTKYIVYTADENNPDRAKQIKKIKHEKEAILFINDFGNLADYGCMTLVKVTDDGEYLYDNDHGEWITKNAS